MSLFLILGLILIMIVRKLDSDRYEYFLSRQFDSMRLDDLKSIYKNLIAVKEEIKLY